MPLATVVLPTHDHGPLLRWSLRTVQEQTVEDLEIFVVGDGVPDETRELLAEHGRADSRIRFFDNPKGPRHGELHRAAALAEARGEIVCYQADDDLWCPEQVAELRDLLSAADFAHTVVLSVAPDGSLTPCLAALEAGVLRARMLRGIWNFLPLSGVGHTLAAYRALPYGWRTTPQSIWTDLYMWQQFLEQPRIRVASGSRPAVVSFPTPPRRTWTVADRLAELESWYAFLGGRAWRDELEPALSVRCAGSTKRLRRRLRALEPLAGSARSRRVLGKVPRRLGWELWEHEVGSVTRWPSSELPTDLTPARAPR
jgi:GalNAc5-diNAcBac-PP-undecaprenol beta-1,3-glucosyltransferase